MVEVSYPLTWLLIWPDVTLTKPKCFYLGCLPMLPVGESLFRSSVCLPFHNGPVRRSNNSGIYDHYIHVLHPRRTNETNWILVWVFPTKSLIVQLTWQQPNQVAFNGVAIIFLGFLSFGILHTTTSDFMPWQWWVIWDPVFFSLTQNTGWWSLREYWPLLPQSCFGTHDDEFEKLISLNEPVRFFFPDSPTTARFLDPQERVLAVQRIKPNQAGLENKHWKRDQ